MFELLQYVRRNTEVFVEALKIKDSKLYALPNDLFVRLTAKS